MRFPWQPKPDPDFERRRRQNEAFAGRVAKTHRAAERAGLPVEPSTVVDDMRYTEPTPRPGFLHRGGVRRRTVLGTILAAGGSAGLGGLWWAYKNPGEVDAAIAAGRAAAESARSDAPETPPAKTDVDWLHDPTSTSASNMRPNYVNGTASNYVGPLAQVYSAGTGTSTTEFHQSYPDFGSIQNHKTHIQVYKVRANFQGASNQAESERASVMVEVLGRKNPDGTYNSLKLEISPDSQNDSVVINANERGRAFGTEYKVEFQRGIQITKDVPVGIVPLDGQPHQPRAVETGEIRVAVFQKLDNKANPTDLKTVVAVLDSNNRVVGLWEVDQLGMADGVSLTAERRSNGQSSQAFLESVTMSQDTAKEVYDQVARRLDDIDGQEWETRNTNLTKFGGQVATIEDESRYRERIQNADGSSRLGSRRHDLTDGAGEAYGKLGL